MPNKLEIKYVEIEVLDRKGKASLEKGLFVGFTKDEKNVRFINISQEYSCRFFSEEYYNVSCVNVRYEKTSRQHFFKASEQIEAFDFVRDTLIQLRELKMCDGNGVVNLKCYSHLPSKYNKNKLYQSDLKVSNAKTETIKPASSLPAVVTPPETNTARQYPLNNNYNKKPKPEPVYIRRRSVKPTDDFLKQLKKKVRQITKDSYDAAPLPEVRTPRGKSTGK